MVKSTEVQLDAVFHALSDPTRRAILRDVANGERTVGAIAEPYPISLAAVSKHIKVLESAHLIRRQRRGSFQIVRLNPEPMRQAEEWLAFYEKFWDQRLDTLQAILEEENKEGDESD